MLGEPLVACTRTSATANRRSHSLPPEASNPVPHVKRCSRGVPLWVLTAAGSLLLACRGPEATSPPEPRPFTPLAHLSVRHAAPPTLFVLPDVREATFDVTDPDGRRRLILHRMRLSVRPDGTLARGDELFAVGEVRALDLPARLGGGVLFYASTSNETLFWRASEWTGRLTPLASLGFVAGSLTIGFDRVYVQTQESRELVALDPVSGAGLDLGPLPAAPAFGAMAFADPWLAAVDVPLRGALVTFDAGGSWHALGGGGAQQIEAVEGQLHITAGASHYVVSPSGRVFPATESPHPAMADPGSRDHPVVAPKTEPVRPPTPGPLGRRALWAAVVHGWPVSRDTAVLAHEGVLAKVRLTDGKILDSLPGALPAKERCTAVPLGDGVGFVCGSEGGQTHVYEFGNPLGLRAVLAYAEPRFVAASGNGALVVKGGCAGPVPAEGNRYCIVRDGAMREVEVRGDSGAERIVALHGGSVAVLVPPRLGAPGSLTLIDEAGRPKALPLVLPKTRRAPSALLRSGLWLNGFVEDPSGRLSGWVAAGEAFAGVRIDLDGRVRVGPLKQDLDRALLTERFALVPGSGGVAEETVDGGFTWREVELPAEALEDDPIGRDYRGCSRVGCVLGGWIRVGWQGKQRSQGLEMADNPEPTAFPVARGGRWTMDCRPVRTGRAGAQREPEAASGDSGGPAAGASAPPSAETIQGSGFTSFGGSPPPQRANHDVGFGVLRSGDHGDVQVYAWGPRTGDWTRAGSWLIRGRSVFDLAPPWSTLPQATPWADVLTAARAFGSLPAAGPAPQWQVLLEPAGTSGILFVGAAGTSELFVFERDRAIAHVEGAAQLGLRSASSAVKVDGSWYVGSEADVFTVHEIRGGQVRLVGNYPLLDASAGGGRLSTRVVRTLQGGQLGIWVREHALHGPRSRWYVHPLDEVTGTIGEPLVLAPERLAKLPRPCSDGDDGWLLPGQPPVMPHVELAQIESGRVSSLSARLVATPDALCLDALAAELSSDDPVPLRSARGATPRAAIPMIVSRGPGQRWEFACGP